MKNAGRPKTIQPVSGLFHQTGPQRDRLSPHVLKGIEESIRQHENGRTISLSEFKEKHFSKK
jgi:hypothetical protein